MAKVVNGPCGAMIRAEDHDELVKLHAGSDEACVEAV